MFGKSLRRTLAISRQELIVGDLKFTPHIYKQFGWLPIELIQDAISNNYLDSLCYFMWMRTAYNNATFYKPTLRQIADKLNCSPTTAGYHIKILLSKGLLYQHHGNLCLLGRKRLKVKYNSIMVPVGVDKNKSNQITYLRFAAVKKNLKSQIVKHAQKSEVLKFRNGIIQDRKQEKRLTKISDQYPSNKIIENSKQDCLTLSNNRFGIICNRSQSTGIKIQKKLNDLFLIKSVPRLKRLLNERVNRGYFFSLELNSAHFLSNRGYVTKRLSNELVLL